MAVSLLLTAGASFYVSRTADAKDRLRFNNATERLADSISSGMQTYVALLRGVAGFYAADQSVSRQDFARYVERLDPVRRYPGLRGIGFVTRLQTGQEGSLAAIASSQGEPGFRVWPDPADVERYVITRLEPLDDSHRAALGFDMLTDPARREAMELSRDTGLPTATGRVLLRREIDPQQPPGFLLFVPVYRPPTVPETLEARRANLIGFAYSPFRFSDLLEGLLVKGVRPDLDFAIYDGPTPTDMPLRGWRTDPAARGRFGWLTGTRSIDVGGRIWTIQFAALPGFMGGSAGDLASLALLTGGAVSLFLFGTMWMQEASRKRAERAAADLRRSEAELRISESRFRRLFDANIVGICIGRFDGTILDGNEASFRSFGRRREEMVGGPVGWADITPPEFAEADARAVEELRATGRCTPFEKEYVHPDGARVTVLAAAAMLEESADSYIAFTLDITASKRAELDLATARDAAEKANRAKDRFLAILSHELRGPLAPILALADLNADDLDLSDEHREDWAVVARNVAWEARLVEDLLDVTRIGRGKMVFHRTRIDLHDVLRSAADAAREGPAAKKRQRVEVELLAEHHQIVGDPLRLGQVFANLLGNAAKFTPDGGRIALRSRDAGGGVVRVEVQDDGIGIDPAVLPRIFSAFEQGEGEANRVYGGLGLGLSIVRGIVEAHGGAIRAASDGPGRGSTFTVDLHAAETLGRNGSGAAGAAKSSGVPVSRRASDAIPSARGS